MESLPWPKHNGRTAYTTVQYRGASSASNSAVAPTRSFSLPLGGHGRRAGLLIPLYAMLLAVITAASLPVLVAFGLLGTRCRPPLVSGAIVGPIPVLILPPWPFPVALVAALSSSRPGKSLLLDLWLVAFLDQLVDEWGQHLLFRPLLPVRAV